MASEGPTWICDIVTNNEGLRGCGWPQKLLSQSLWLAMAASQPAGCDPFWLLFRFQFEEKKKIVNISLFGTNGGLFYNWIKK